MPVDVTEAPTLEPKTARRRFSVSHPRKVAFLYRKDDTIDWFSHDQTLEQYENQLGFDRKELQGKIVLDLGTSVSDQLARNIKEAGIDATVIGISPDLRNENIRQHPNLPKEWKRQAVAGIGQALPFKGNSIDIILGAFSVTWAATTYSQQVKAWISEIRRVLKDGGEARVGPTYIDIKTSGMGKELINVKEFGKEAGLKVSIHDGKNENDVRHSYILFQKPAKK